MEPIQTDLVVVGGGPGGYTAAFYAADKGKHVLLVEEDRQLGGVCLNRGCIPSKALLHATQLIREAHASAQRGIQFGEPKIRIEQLRQWKEAMIAKLAQGLSQLGKQRNVDVLTGRGYFEESHTLRVETPQGQQYVHYDRAIIAVGSRPALPAALDLGHPHVMTSTEALELHEVPTNLLIVGGGYIGMELGTVYATLGSRVVIVEAMEGLLSEVDTDLTRPVRRYAEQAFQAVRVSTKVAAMATDGTHIRATLEAGHQSTEERYDRVLIAIGRVPNCEHLGVDNTKIARDRKGFIQVDARQQTADPAILAIGDVTGGAMLAHKAFKDARIAVDAILDEPTSTGAVIPAVIYTDPEIAWCGLTEAQAKARGIAVQVSKFPWAASGRALTLDRPEGLTKLILEPETGRILGVGLVGMGAGELISEGVVAVEVGLTAEDLAESVHPHPTLSETLKECAEAAFGLATHVVSKHTEKQERRT